MHGLPHEFRRSFSNIFNVDSRAIAHLRGLRVAIAIQRYRLATGTLPDILADLVPAYLESIPEDPFDGNDMRYKKLKAGGFVVYSIGEDLSDDAGKEKLPRKAREQQLPNWDVTFIVER